MGFADFGAPNGTPVLWCHGGPGSRLEAVSLGEQAAAAGLRIVGIDRPGYGKSTPLPERTIGAWPSDGLAVADHLGLERFAVVGVSTGGAYSLALAAAAPARVLGAIACCALTDMRWAEGKAGMSGDGTVGIWNAPDRVTALARAMELFGADGSKMLTQAGGGPALPPPTSRCSATPPGSTRC